MQCMIMLNSVQNTTATELTPSQIFHGEGAQRFDLCYEVVKTLSVWLLHRSGTLYI